MTRREYGTVIILFLAGILFLCFVWKKKTKSSSSLIFTFLTSILLHGIYIGYTPTWERQHDVIGFENAKGIGQAAYIEWFYNNWSLPNFDPRERWGFFQPALHHIIAAIWLKINIIAGFGYTAATENIQILMLIYCIVLTIYALRIYKLCGLEGRSLETAFALTALHPSLVLLSGSVNNDTLCIMLMVMTCFYALKWEKNSNYANILKTALCTGLSMMTKLSGVLTAPAVAWLFLIKWLVGGKKDFVRYLKQYLIFACVSIPLGMFFPLRNYFLFGIPFNYTPEVGEKLVYKTVASRFTDLITKTPFAAMIKNGDDFDEYNILLAGLKTSLTGEFNFAAGNSYMLPVAWGLFISAVILMLITVVSVIKVIVAGKNIIPLQIRVFWSILYLTAIAFYLRLCLSIPNFSSQDFRYIAYLIVPNALCIGLMRQNVAGFFRTIITLFALIFTFSSTVLYLLLGLP